MRSRVLAIAVVLILGWPEFVPAQCITLGTPGLTGCLPPLPSITAPSISCNGTTPNLGNSGFSVASGSFFGSSPYPFLALGPCAVSPIPLPTASPLCPPAPLGCFAFVDYFDFFILVAPVVGQIWLLPIPTDPALVGATVCAQGIGPCVTFCNCLSVSNGLQITILP